MTDNIHADDTEDDTPTRDLPEIEDDDTLLEQDQDDETIAQGVEDA